MYRKSRFTVSALSAAAGFALITGCTADPAPTPEATGTPSPAGPASLESTATASPTASSGSAAAGSAAPNASGASIGLGPEDEHRITEPNTTVSITCADGGDIDIETNGTTVRTAGQCEDLDITGNNNTVTGENAESLDVQGSNNTATLTNTPEIDVDGDTNSITVEDTRNIDVEGDNNTVTYSTGNPAVENQGNNNSVGVR